MNAQMNLIINQEQDGRYIAHVHDDDASHGTWAASDRPEEAAREAVKLFVGGSEPQVLPAVPEDDQAQTGRFAQDAVGVRTLVEDAIINDKFLMIHYSDRDGNDTVRTIDPWNTTDFVLRARDLGKAEEDSIRGFRLDRIKSAAIIDR